MSIIWIPPPKTFKLGTTVMAASQNGKWKLYLKDKGDLKDQGDGKEECVSLQRIGSAFEIGRGAGVGQEVQVSCSGDQRDGKAIN